MKPECSQKRIKPGVLCNISGKLRLALASAVDLVPSPEGLMTIFYCLVTLGDVQLTSAYGTLRNMLAMLVASRAYSSLRGNRRFSSEAVHRYTRGSQKVPRMVV
jgi:hypothetical protein